MDLLEEGSFVLDRALLLNEPLHDLIGVTLAEAINRADLTKGDMARSPELGIEERRDHEGADGAH
jgi:hypothetical protein